MNGVAYIRQLAASWAVKAVESTDFPDNHRSDHFFTAAVIMERMQWQTQTFSQINADLAMAGCSLDSATVEFLLNAFSGSDPKTALWSRDQAGLYTVLRAPAQNQKRR